MVSTPEFKVIIVTRKNYERRENETIGSKPKFWFKHEELDLCLYKQARQNIGEDWAEKVAAELCELLGLPHAIYHLAETWDRNRIANVSRANILEIFSRIPNTRISSSAAEFAQRILEFNRCRLLTLRGTLP